MVAVADREGRRAAATAAAATSEVLAARRRGLTERLAARGVDAALLTHSRDVLYYAGTAQPANLLLASDRSPLLFARRAVELIREDVSGLEVVAEASFTAVARELVAGGATAGTLGLTLDALPATHLRRLEALFGDWRLEDVSGSVLGQRAVKDAGEIEAIERAAGLAEVVDTTVRELCRPGIAPVELMAEVGRRLRRRGAEELMFFRRWDAWLPMSGICASGPEAAVISGHAMTVTGLGLSRALPWGPSWRPIARGEPIYIDLGLNLGGYHADVTRTYVIGPPSGKVKALFAVALEAQEAAIEALAPGAGTAEPMLAARRVVARHGQEGFFQGHGQQQGDYVGHGLGLELDEAPLLDSRDRGRLEPGTCLAIEAKLIVPGLGGVGIEDTVTIGAAGPRLLTSPERTLVEL